MEMMGRREMIVLSFYVVAIIYRYIENSVR